MRITNVKKVLIGLKEMGKRRMSYTQTNDDEKKEKTMKNALMIFNEDIKITRQI